MDVVFGFTFSVEGMAEIVKVWVGGKWFSGGFLLKVC